MRVALLILSLFSSHLYAIGLDDIFDPITDTTKNIYNSTIKILSLDRCDESKLFTQWHDCTQTLSYDNGDKYEGYWLHGRKHGQGSYEYKTPLYYKGYKVQKFEGTWKSNLRDGLGIFHTTNDLKIEIVYTGGNLYKGSFVKIFYPNGDYYKGNIDEYGRYDGKGELKSNKTVYKGQFKKNAITGKGTLITDDNATYTGEFDNGLMTGYGRVIYEDGLKYTGDWKDGYFHGEGTLFGSGINSSGYWERGKLIKEYGEQYFKKNLTTKPVTSKNASSNPNIIKALFLIPIIIIILTFMLKQNNPARTQLDNNHKVNYSKPKLSSVSNATKTQTSITKVKPDTFNNKKEKDEVIKKQKEKDELDFDL